MGLGFLVTEKNSMKDEESTRGKIKSKGWFSLLGKDKDKKCTPSILESFRTKRFWIKN